MGKKRFIGIGTTKLDLSDGDWIEVKDELSYGEQLELSNASFVGQEGFRAIIDMSRYHLLRMEKYIVDWNLKDAQGKSVEINRTTLALLSQDAAEEINAALDAHIQAMSQPDEEPPAAPKEATSKNGRSASKSNV